MVTKSIDYFFTVVSPWSWLGHARLVEVAAKHGALIHVKPIDLGRVFPVSGGLPLAKRAPQRQAYRLVELARWRDYLDVPINLQPKFGTSSGLLAERWILAAAELGTPQALALAGAIMRARWVEERDIAAADTLAEIASSNRLDAAALAARAGAPEVTECQDALTQEAIARGVFGAPTYIVGEEMFWGQDRLDFLDRKLAQ